MSPATQPSNGPGDRFVVVGASIAGLRAIEVARRRGYDGKITLIGAEHAAPYERPPLSKAALAAHSSSEDFLPSIYRSADALTGELGVELRLGVPATQLDTERRLVHVEDALIPYDKLVIATGARAKNLQGTEYLQGIYTLRTVDDARELRAELDTARDLVVVGGGFIGSEVAASARARGIKVTIVESDTVLLRRALGEHMGDALAQIHERNGTRVLRGVTVEGFDGTRRVRGVVLSNGTTISADLVVVGVGSTPNVEWLAGSGLTILDGVMCDTYLCAGPADVYAAGDVARWPNPANDDRLTRTENWTGAAEQGAAAATNALFPENRTEFGTVPYFWSDWYDTKIQLVGSASTDFEIVEGGVNEQTCVALFYQHDRLVGALTLNKPADVMKYRAQIKQHTQRKDATAFAAARRLHPIGPGLVSSLG